MEEEESDRYPTDIPPYVKELKELAEKEKIPIQQFRFRIRDRDIPSREMMKEILDTIDHSIQKGQPVFVHCLGGIGRTGTVVGCYLLRHGLADHQNVLEKIRILRIGTVNQFAISPETEAQREFVETWEE
jgi:protein-tyrosine phosphatase